MITSVTVYAVFKQGAYRHECGGIYTELVDAEAFAKRLAEIDHDGYHTYEVIPFTLNQSPVAERKMKEPAPVRSFKRGDDGRAISVAIAEVET